MCDMKCKKKEKQKCEPCRDKADIKEGLITIAIVLVIFIGLAIIGG